MEKNSLELLKAKYQTLRTLLVVVLSAALTASIAVPLVRAKYVSNGDVVFAAALDGISTDDLEEVLLNCTYPVGAIYMSVDDKDPGTLFGGTWTRWGQGRVPLSAGSWTDSSSETQSFAVAPLASYAETSGGTYSQTLSSTQIPNHYHSVPTHNHTATFSNGRVVRVGQGTAANTNGNVWVLNPTIAANYDLTTGGGGNAAVTWTVSGTVTVADKAAFNTSTDGGNGTSPAHPNVQPYVTCYMWRRTA